MLTVTDKARTLLDKYFEDKEPAPLRIHVKDGGCAGQHLAVAALEPGDEAGDDDLVVDEAGYEFLIQPDLRQAVGEVTVDAAKWRFVVTGERPLPAANGCEGVKAPGGCQGCPSAG